jgi:hypothetical protein
VTSPELYDLETDEREQTNLAGKHPDVVTRLERLLQEQHVPSKDFPLPTIDQPVKK